MQILNAYGVHNASRRWWIRPSAAAASLVPVALVAILVTGGGNASAAVVGRPAIVKTADEGVETANESRAASITLPSGAFRSTEAPDVARFEDALRKMAAANQGSISSVEVLGWSKENQPRKKLPAVLKKAGFEYAAQPTEKVDDLGDMTVFACKSADRGTLIGFWVETGDVALLAWGKFTAGSGAASPEASSTTAPESGDAAPLPKARSMNDVFNDYKKAQDALYSGASSAAAPSAESATQGKVSADLVGTWQWTTINGHQVVDKDGRWVSDGGGMSNRFTFDSNGHYKKLFYVKMQSRPGWITESTSTEEGAVTFHDNGTLTLKPTQGHYKGSDSLSGKREDRPMKASELKSQVYHWEWRTVEGKRQLMIGPETQSMTHHRRVAE